MAKSTNRKVPIGEALDQLSSLTAMGVLVALAHAGPATVTKLTSNPNDDSDEVRAALEDLVERGYVTRGEDAMYAASVDGRAW